MKAVRLDEGYQDTSAAGFTKRMVHQAPDALVFRRATRRRAVAP